jgi:hypothetical protein
MFFNALTLAMVGGLPLLGLVVDAPTVGITISILVIFWRFAAMLSVMQMDITYIKQKFDGLQCQKSEDKSCENK